MRPGSRTIQRHSAMGAGLGLARGAAQPESAPAAPLKARAGRGVAHSPSVSHGSHGAETAFVHRKQGSWVLINRYFKLSPLNTGLHH